MLYFPHNPLHNGGEVYFSASDLLLAVKELIYVESIRTSLARA